MKKYGIKILKSRLICHLVYKLLKRFLNKYNENDYILSM